jgi:signal transduction histidine kinase
VKLRRDELLLGAGLAAAGVAGTFAEGYSAPAMVASAVAGGSLGAARRHTRIAWVVTAAALFATAPYGFSFAAALLGAAHVFCAGRWEGLWPGLAALVAITGAMLLSLGLDNESPVPALLVCGAGWAAGRALGERERVAAQLAERVRELDEEREAHAALSVRYERARIASELHDIVAHAISVMVVQAGAGQRLAADDPEGTAAAFDAIASAAREAEQDMQRLVALLGDEEPIGPAPDLALVEELVRRAAGSGLNVTLRLEGEREGLPQALVETAYRLVQEGLTNALRYASGAAVRVLVVGGSREVLVEVENAPSAAEPALAGAGTGNGLRGLRERIAPLGGTLDAGPTAGGGWRLRGRLPRRASASHPLG